MLTTTAYSEVTSCLTTRIGSRRLEKSVPESRLVFTNRDFNCCLQANALTELGIICSLSSGRLVAKPLRLLAKEKRTFGIAREVMGIKRMHLL